MLGVPTHTIVVITNTIKCRECILAGTMIFSLVSPDPECNSSVVLLVIVPLNDKNYYGTHTQMCMCNLIAFYTNQLTINSHVQYSLIIIIF